MIIDFFQFRAVQALLNLQNLGQQVRNNYAIV